MDLLSSDLALRCGDRGEAEASGRGASLGRSCGREQSRQHQPVPHPLEPQEGGLQGRVAGKEWGFAVWCLGTSAPADRTCVQMGPMPRLLVLSLQLPAGA